MALAAATYLFGYDARFGLQVARAMPGGQVFLTCIDDLGNVTNVQGPLPAQPANVGASSNCLAQSTGAASQSEDAIRRLIGRLRSWSGERPPGRAAFSPSHHPRRGATP